MVYGKDIGKSSAVLFVHGILGTPRHFEPFIPQVVSGWTVVNIQLKGHGGRARDFSTASMDEWKRQVSLAAEELRRTHGCVVIAAHSMGTLFALNEAVGGKADALFLLNVPLKLHIRPRLLRMLWSVFTGKIDPEDGWTMAALNACGVEVERNILAYVGWIPRFLELFREMRAATRLLPELGVPCRVYLSAHDELLSMAPAAAMAQNPNISVTVLENSGHYYYSPEDMGRMQEDFSLFLSGFETIPGNNAT